MAFRSHQGSWLWIVFLLSIFLSACQPQRLPTPPSSVQDHPDWISIETSREGIYRIQASDVRKAGLEIKVFQADALVLWRKGESVPFQVVDQGQALLFYARPPAGPYSPSEVHWLLLAKDQEAIHSKLGNANTNPLAESPPDEPDLFWTTGPADQVVVSKHLEENKLYTPQVEQGDRWLWEAYSAPETRTFDINLPSAARGPGRLQLQVWARTEGPGPVDHHWELWLNDQLIGDAQWDGKGVHQITLSIPAGWLNSGQNRLEIRCLNDTGLKADIVYLDSIELDYFAQPVPEDDRLVFQAAGETLNIQGFSGEVAGFQQGPESGAVELLGLFSKGDTLPTIPGQRYWLAGSQSILTPDHIKPGRLGVDLLSPAWAAEYLVVAPQALLSALDPLLQFHASHGLEARAVALEDIYAQFSSGFPEPEAIQGLIQYAAEHWNTAPGYLLLVGDATYDPFGYLGAAKSNLLPTFFVDTIFGGQTASDIPYSQLDGDGFPDLAVGRVPAGTSAEVEKFVKKTLAYAEAIPSLKTPSILAVADGQDPSFRADAESFLGQFPDQISTRLLNPPAGTAGAARDLIRTIEEGFWLVSYFGHGSIDMWGKDRLLTASDVYLLDDPAVMPVVVNMTCLTGLFTHPKIQSLAEAMLFQEPGGAVAVLAPTSLTLPGDQSFLSQALADALLTGEEVIIGDVLLQARRSIPLESPGARDVLLTFLLFGDPALRIR